jgi:hypothetical protein
MDTPTHSCEKWEENIQHCDLRSCLGATEINEIGPTIIKNHNHSPDYTNETEKIAELKVKAILNSVKSKIILENYVGESNQIDVIGY